MRVFLSWSGGRSKKIAEILKEWLPTVIQAVKPYFSPDDIQKGSRWGSEVAKELEKCIIGIVVLTPDNIKAPWIMFEAGALSRTIDKSKVCPLLFELEPSDIEPPLSQFQAAVFSKNEIFKILKMINESLESHKLEESIIEKSFERGWEELKNQIDSVELHTSDTAKEQVRDDRDLLEEILLLTRSLSDRQSTRREPLLNPEPIKELLVILREFLEECRNLYWPKDMVEKLHELKKPLNFLTMRVDHPSTDLRKIYTQISETIDNLGVKVDIPDDDLPF